MLVVDGTQMEGARLLRQAVLGVVGWLVAAFVVAEHCVDLSAAL